MTETRRRTSIYMGLDEDGWMTYKQGPEIPQGTLCNCGQSVSEYHEAFMQALCRGCFLAALPKE